MNIVIISGSHRTISQSEKVSRWMAEELETRGHTTDVLTLKDNPYPLWTEDAWNPESEVMIKMKPELERVGKADAVIIVAAEWSGMAPAGIKNFLLYTSANTIGHKPVLLVGISASRGGTYPIAEMRMSSFKNNKIVYIPDHLVIQKVESVMNSQEPDPDNKMDQYIQDRARFALGTLEAYAEAMRDLRSDDRVQTEKYQYGM